jgi:hypothetical protein
MRMNGGVQRIATTERRGDAAAAALAEAGSAARVPDGHLITG